MLGREGPATLKSHQEILTPVSFGEAVAALRSDDDDEAEAADLLLLFADMKLNDTKSTVIENITEQEDKEESKSALESPVVRSEAWNKGAVVKDELENKSVETRRRVMRRLQWTGR